MSLARSAALTLLAILLTGCTESDADIANGDDPLRALTVAHRSERYETSFWTQTSVRDPQLWGRATAYCEDKKDGEYPNCAAVRQVQMVDRMSRPPEDRPNDFRLTVPQAGEPGDEPKQP
jgi:hypothetical protein